MVKFPMDDSNSSFFPEVSIEDRTDRTGRCWKNSEILALGVKRFEEKYAGNYRASISLFGRAAYENKLARKTKLILLDQQLFDRLDHTLYRTERNWETMAWQVSGGGTACLGQALRLHAGHEEALWRLAITWNHSAKATGSWVKAMEQVRKPLESRFLEKNGLARRIGSENRDLYAKARHDAIQALDVLERLCPQLPHAAIACCTQRLQILRALLDYWYFGTPSRWFFQD